MKRTIGIHLGDGEQVGTLRFGRQGGRESASFEFSGDTLGARSSFALGPTLPLKAGPQFHRKSPDGSLSRDGARWATKLV